MKGSFRTLFKKYCLESTVLGLKYFYLYPDWVSRCFWAVNMLLIFMLACLLTFMLYYRFEKMPTRITIENQYEPVTELPYPTITICSPNQITISAVEHFKKTLVNGNLTTHLEKILPQLLGFYQPIIDFDSEELQVLQSLIDLNRYTIPEVMSLLPQSCEDFLPMCTFQSKRYPHCRGIFQPIMTTHGLCCAFNSNYFLKDGRRNEQKSNHKSHLVKSSGTLSALSVIADYNPMDALDGTVLTSGAIRVLFNDHTEFPADDISCLVVTNAETFHVMHATYTYCSEEVQHLPVWSRKCYMEHEQKLRFFDEYRNSDCDHLCLVTAVEEACHCLMFHVPYLKVGHSCNVTSLPCIMKAKMHMYKWLPSGHCECPRDCESRRYAVESSTGNFNGLAYVLHEYYDHIMLNKSTSIMHFSFPKSVYVKQKQETVMSLISLASNLGGVFGLCVGCSAISVAEFFFYVYIGCRSCFKKRRERRRLQNFN